MLEGGSRSRTAAWGARLALVGLVGLAAACGGGPGPVSPGSVLPTLSETVSTEAIDFHHAPGDSVEADWQQAFHAWVTRRLGVSVPGRVQFYKYASDSQMRALVGRGCCFAEPEQLAVHTTYPRDNHEVVHVYSALVGTPSNFFNEGLAVAFQTDPPAGDLTPRWNGSPLHALAGDFRRQGRLIPVDNLIETNDFRRFDTNVTYPEAGSFVQYLEQTQGLEAVLELFRSGSGPSESGSDARAHFRAAFGRPLGDAEREWLAFLDETSGEGSATRPTP